MTEPTDAELLALIEKHLGFKPRRDDTVIDPRTGRFHDVQRYRDLKADILAKWGTPPAVAGEVVHQFRRAHCSDWYDGLADHSDGGGPYEERTLYTAGAVPLTDEQIAEMMRDTWGCASIAPRHALEFARAVERAHGIAQKGGSNADT